MIRHYNVTITYPDHYIPLTDEQLRDILWDGLPILPHKDVEVEHLNLLEQIHSMCVQSHNRHGGSLAANILKLIEGG